MEKQSYRHNKNIFSVQTVVVTRTLLLLAVIASCSARVTQTYQPIQAPTNQFNGAKSPATRVMHPAFANAGRNPGLEIWRIENFNPVAYQPRDYGKFYTGDSFIVLNSKKDNNNKFSYDVHFWLGSDTSQDEAGSAAILTVQLDDLLNGVPVQHRETQDHESSLFLSYFKNGVRYEQGGVGTGFRHVQTNAAGEKRLFQVKGKRNVRVRQVNLSVSSMNKGDCFILDAGNDIYVYVGSGAKRVEKLKAISAANQIRDQDHNGRSRVNIIDEFSTDLDKQQFFTIMGSGSPSEVPEESTGEEDGAFETADERSVTLYKVTDQSGSLRVDTVSSKPLRQEMLETSDCFILDTGSGIFVWVGRGATQQEKSQAMIKAQDFLKTKKYPAWTEVHRIVEGAESAPFKQYFSTWRDVGMQHTRLVRAAMGYDSDVADEDIDTSVIDKLKKSGGRAIGFMPDSGDKPIVKVWQVMYRPDLQEVTHNELPLPDDFDLILGFASYIFQYNYENKNGETGTILYAWEGETAPENTKTEVLKFASKISEELGNVMVVRIVQGHEPRHFLKIFKGKLVSTITGAPVKPQLFRIRGTDANDVSAVEVKADSASLASDDVFALVSAEKAVIWIGTGASDFEKDMAETRVRDFWKSKEMEIIQEGSEPSSFWEHLNGEGPYDKSVGKSGAPILEPRLFHCRIMTNGKIRNEEIPHYVQDDLDIDDVMILDGGDEVYAWVGESTSTEEKQRAFDMAMEYISKDPSHRNKETIPIIKLHQGQEPKYFRQLFPVWDKEHWKSILSYADVKKQLEEKNNEISYENGN